MDKKSTIIVVSILVLYSLVFILSVPDYSPSWDEAWHLLLAKNIQFQLQGESVSTLPFSIYDFAASQYPPAFHFLSALLLLLAVPWRFFQLIPLLLLGTSMFFIGKKLGTIRWGYALLLFSLCVPFVLYYSRRFLVDVPLLSVVAASFAMLLYADKFSSRLYSILFGVVCGIGMLIKPVFGIFIITPVFFHIDLKEYRNILYSAFAGLMLCLWWYVIHFSTVIQRMLVTASFGSLESDPTGIAGFLFYPEAFMWGLGLFIFIILFSLYFKKPIKYYLYILVPYVFFSLFPNKDPRYIIPLIPFLLIMLLFVKRRYAHFVQWSVVAASLVSVILFLSVPTVTAGSFILHNTVDYPEPVVLPLIPGENYSLCVIAESARLNDVNVQYYLFQNKSPVSLVSGNGCDPRQYDYALVGPIDTTWRSNLFLQSKRLLEKDFSPIDINGEVILYKNLR